jgi:hypothetical protein
MQRVNWRLFEGENQFRTSQKPGNHHAAARRAGNEGTGRRATEIAKALKIGRASV